MSGEAPTECEGPRTAGRLRGTRKKKNGKVSIPRLLVVPVPVMLCAREGASQDLPLESKTAMRLGECLGSAVVTATAGAAGIGGSVGEP